MKWAYEEFDAAIFNLLHGYYKQSINALRSVLDIIIVGTYLETLDAETKKLEGDKWVGGRIEIKFGNGCDRLQKNDFIQRLEKHLEQKTDDSLFRQKNSNQGYDGGYIRRLYAKLSKYAHSEPGHTNGALWRRKGPILNASSFNLAGEYYCEILILCIALVKIFKEDFTPGGDGLVTLSRLCNLPIVKRKAVLAEVINFCNLVS